MTFKPDPHEMETRTEPAVIRKLIEFNYYFENVIAAIEQDVSVDVDMTELRRLWEPFVNEQNVYNDLKQADDAHQKLVERGKAFESERYSDVFATIYNEATAPLLQKAVNDFETYKEYQSRGYFPGDPKLVAGMKIGLVWFCTDNDNSDELASFVDFVFRRLTSPKSVENAREYYLAFTTIYYKGFEWRKDWDKILFVDTSLRPPHEMMKKKILRFPNGTQQEVYTPTERKRRHEEITTPRQLLELRSFANELDKLIAGVDVNPEAYVYVNPLMTTWHRLIDPASFPDPPDPAYDVGDGNPGPNWRREYEETIISIESKMKIYTDVLFSEDLKVWDPANQSRTDSDYFTDKGTVKKMKLGLIFGTIKRGDSALLKEFVDLLRGNIKEAEAERVRYYYRYFASIEYDGFAWIRRSAIYGNDVDVTRNMRLASAGHRVRR